MRIGIDIDDTITDTYYEILKFLCEEKNIDFETLKNKNYNYDQIYDGCEGNPPMGQFIWDNFYRIIPNIQLKENVAQIMQKIIDDGNEIVIITARNHAKPNQTQQYLKEKNIPYNKFYEGIKDKGRLAKEENIDLFIDDSIKNCKQVDENNIKVLLFDAPYNRECKQYQRVYDWNEAYKIIQGIND